MLVPCPLLNSILLKEKNSPFSVSPRVPRSVSTQCLVPSQDFKYSAVDRTLDLRTEELGLKSNVLSSTFHYAFGRTSPSVLFSILRA